MPVELPDEAPQTRAAKRLTATKVISRLALVLMVPVALFILWLPFSRPGAREFARRTQCKNNLKQISLALHNYHDVYRTFPPAYTVDAKGNRLHSWRTLILPFLDQQRLYDQVDLSVPWDAPENQMVRETSLDVYRCPSSHVPPGQTNYRGIALPGSIFEPGQCRRIRDIKDGTFNTIFVAEVAEREAISWMAPYDAGEEELFGNDKIAPRHFGFQVLFGDGSVRVVSLDLEDEAMKAMYSIDGGEVVGSF